MISKDDVLLQFYVIRRESDGFYRSGYHMCVSQGISHTAALYQAEWYEHSMPQYVDRVAERLTMASGVPHTRVLCSLTRDSRILFA